MNSIVARVVSHLIRLLIGLTMFVSPAFAQTYHVKEMNTEQIKALDRGVSVRRRYVLASCQDGPKCPEVSEVKLGDVIRVDTRDNSYIERV